jgi:hypothetical protein
MDQAQARLLLDHRISIAAYIAPPWIDWQSFDSVYGPLLNGSAGTLLAGARLTSLMYTTSASIQLDASVIQNWVSHLSLKGWLGPLFHYTCDEPPAGCTFAQALANTATVHTASSLMKTLVTTDLATATQNNFLGNVDILVPNVAFIEPPGGANQRSTYDSWLAAGNKHLWWNQSCAQHGSCTNGIAGPASATWPSYMVDASPVRNRVFQWLAFLDRIEAEGYYQIDYCWINTAPNCGSSDPWTSVYALGGNGDGTLIYPGTPDRIGGSTPIALPSIRLKYIRDGMQDYEYLIALSRAGYDGLARSAAASFIANAHAFSNDPQALRNARQAIGNWLNRLALLGRCCLTQ